MPFCSFILFSSFFILSFLFFILFSLFHWVMQFCILLISTKISKPSASWVILWKKLQLECFSIFVCLSFSSSLFLSVCPFLSISTANLCSDTCQFLLFCFLRLCAAIFSAEMLLIVVLLLIVLFLVLNWFDWILNQLEIWLFFAMIILIELSL